MWITNSKLFKASKYKDKILAAVNDPINRELVKQLHSYVDVAYLNQLHKELDKKDEEIKDLKSGESNVPENDFIDDKASDAGLNSSRPSTSFNPSPGASFDVSPSPSSDGFEDSGDVDLDDLEIDDDLGNEPNDTTDQENTDSSTETSKEPVLSSTYVTVEKVSEAVNQIPGMLNLRDETKGVTYTNLKGTSDSELWIYYDKGVDLSQIIDAVNLALHDSGYYFLEFSRVARDESAIVFKVNWVSNYFNPRQFKSDSE